MPSKTSIANIVQFLKDLRAGPLKHEPVQGDRRYNVFDAQGLLMKTLKVFSDNGSEFKTTTGNFDDALFDKLSTTAPPLIVNRNMLNYRYGNPSAPSQSRFCFSQGTYPVP